MLDYAIIDFDNRKLQVVYESPERQDAEKALVRFQDGSCDIYYETVQGGKVFRVLCRKISVEGNPPYVRK